MHPLFLQGLSDLDIPFKYRPEWSRQEIIAAIPAATGLVIRSKTTVDKEMLDHASTLSFIARAGAGMDKIDEREAKQRGIALINAPEGNRDAVAEHMIGMLLCLLNNIVPSHNQVKEGIWEREANRGHEIQAKTIALVGMGNTGQAMATRLKAFGCRVLGIDPYSDGWEEFAEAATWELVFKEADVLSLHVPLTKETNTMINYDLLAKFEKPFWLLNGSRGQVVDLAAASLAMTEGRINGMGLDVLEIEKPRQWDGGYKSLITTLAESGKVLFTPHIAGWTQESHKKIAEVLIKKIISFLQNN